jgi:mRNA-degrading endonuclease RelE of RelBE toxin-antitoxin system
LNAKASVELLFTEQFEQAYHDLAAKDRQSVRKSVAFLAENPRHPGLRVKRIQGTRNIWEARASRHIRMTFEINGDTIILRNVGAHDKTLKRP